jgi:serine/arginine repetitive matrix protein 1
MPTIKGTSSIPSSEARDKLLKTTKFPKSFYSNRELSLSKINVPVFHHYIDQRITKILGFEDEIVASTAKNLFFPNFDGAVTNPSQQQQSTVTVDPRIVQLDLSGFLGEDAPAFCEEIWDMIVDAHSRPHGIPQKLIEAKKQEMAEADKRALLEKGRDHALAPPQRQPTNPKAINARQDHRHPNSVLSSSSSSQPPHRIPPEREERRRDDSWRRETHAAPHPPRYRQEDYHHSRRMDEYVDDFGRRRWDQDGYDMDRPNDLHYRDPQPRYRDNGRGRHPSDYYERDRMTKSSYYQDERNRSREHSRDVFHDQYAHRGHSYNTSNPPIRTESAHAMTHPNSPPSRYRRSVESTEVERQQRYRSSSSRSYSSSRGDEDSDNRSASSSSRSYSSSSTSRSSSSRSYSSSYEEDHSDSRSSSSTSSSTHSKSHRSQNQHSTHKSSPRGKKSSSHLKKRKYSSEDDASIQGKSKRDNKSK